MLRQDDVTSVDDEKTEIDDAVAPESSDVELDEWQTLVTATVAFLRTAEQVQNLAQKRARRLEANTLRSIRCLSELWTTPDKLRIGGYFVQKMVLTSDGYMRILTPPRQKDEHGNWIPKRLQVRRETRLDYSDLEQDLDSWTDGPTTERPRAWKRSVGRDSVGFSTYCEGGHPSVFLGDIVPQRRKYDVDFEDQGTIPRVALDAINHVQSCDWRINQRVLTVMQHFFGLRGETRNELFRLYGRGRVDREKRVARILELAVEYSEKDCVFFPHHFDFRGRMYPWHTFLSPQGQAEARGLLMFAKGRPLGPDGWKWLAVRIANTFGKDDITFEKRKMWVEERKDEFRAAARDPYADDAIWRKAKPKERWSCLATCFEADAYWTFVEAGNPPDKFLSSLPVPLDGRCNGLQHFASLVRDLPVAREVNVVINEEAIPLDLYRETARKTECTLRERSEQGDEEATQLLDGLDGSISRNLVKPIIMTYTYGAGLEARAGVDKRERLGESETDDKPFQLLRRAGASYEVAKSLAKVLVETVDESAGLETIRKTLSWLQKLGGHLAELGEPFYWTNPVGWRLRAANFQLDPQPYRVRNLLEYGSEYHFLTVHEPSETFDWVDTKKASQSIVANYIQSFDAAHLIRVMSKCREKNIDSVQVIHDSFATHAGQTGELHKLICDEFLNMHQTNWLKELVKEQMKRLPWLESRAVMKNQSGDFERPAEILKLVEHLETLPPYGELDFEHLRVSDYLFG